MTPQEYFFNLEIVNKKKYDALRAFFFENQPAEVVARNYGYTLSAFYSLTRDFRNWLKQDHEDDFFFKPVLLGRKKSRPSG